MDEWTLNDLLECSICLERLDTSSRVLPCQHTFCKKCLVEIVHKHKKLRCPECRVLVEVNIDDLPPNVLLMRILEGMRNTPKKLITAANSTSIITSVSVSSSNNAHPTTSVSSENVPRKVVNKQRQKTNDMQQQPHAIALYTFTAKEPGDLSFHKGDIIYLRRKVDENWYQGECNGLSGVFPVPYVKVIIPMPSGRNTYYVANGSNTPQCKALYDFNQYHKEDEGCLHFNKGDVIVVTRRIDENWVEGKLDDRIGIFPLTFVEMNSYAKALITVAVNDEHSVSRNAPPTPTDESVPLLFSEQSKPLNNTHVVVAQLPTFFDVPMSPPSSSSSAQSTFTTTSPNSSSDSLSPSLSPLYSNHAAIKRHSYTMGALPPPYHAPPTVHHRHSAEIINNSDTNLVLDIGNLNFNHHSTAAHSEQPLSLQLQHENIISQEAQKNESAKIDVQDLLTSNSQTSANENCRASFKIHAPHRCFSDLLELEVESESTEVPLPARYVALYSYKPKKTDELELKKDSIYMVIERCQDGWYKGTSHQNQKGVFPGNYVVPVKTLTRAIELQMIRNSLRSSNTPHTSSSRTKSSHTKRKSAPGSSKSTEKTANKDGCNSKSISTPPELPPRSHSPATVTTTPSESNSISAWLSSFHSTTAFASFKTSTNQSKNTNDFNEPVVSTTNSINLTSTSQFGQSVDPNKSPKSAEKNKERKDKSSSVSLMKRLTSMNMKKSRSPPPENPLFIDTANLIPTNSHIRSDSCPSKLSYNTASSLDNNNRSTGTTNIVAAPHRIRSPANSQRVKSKHRTPINTADTPRRNGKSLKDDRLPAVAHQKSSSLDSTSMTVLDENFVCLHRIKQPSITTKERYRCIAPYPPNSEFELELKIGDVIYVSNKRDDGWYKGTLARNGRNGLFPSSFVEPLKDP